MQFAWTPYDDILHLLPDECHSGSDSWRCETFVVCWEVVEPYLPNRVMRQFSLVQQVPGHIPLTRQVHERLHKETKRGKHKEKDWGAKHQQYIGHWHSRMEHVAEGVPAQDLNISPDYMGWYGERTAAFVDQPSRPSDQSGYQDIAGNMAVLYEGMWQFQQMPGEVGTMASRYIEQSHVDEYFPHVAGHVREGNAPPPPPNVQRARRRPRRRNAPVDAPAPVAEEAANVLGEPINEPTNRSFTFPDLNTLQTGPSYMPDDDLQLSLSFDMSGPHTSDYFTPSSAGNFLGQPSSSNVNIRMPQGRDNPFQNSPVPWGGLVLIIRQLHRVRRNHPGM